MIPVDPLKPERLNPQLVREQAETIPFRAADRNGQECTKVGKHNLPIFPERIFQAGYCNRLKSLFFSGTRFRAPKWKAPGFFPAQNAGTPNASQLLSTRFFKRVQTFPARDAIHPIDPDSLQRFSLGFLWGYRGRRTMESRLQAVRWFRRGEQDRRLNRADGPVWPTWTAQWGNQTA